MLRTRETYYTGWLGRTGKTVYGFTLNAEEKPIRYQVRWHGQTGSVRFGIQTKELAIERTIGVGVGIPEESRKRARRLARKYQFYRALYGVHAWKRKFGYSPIHVGVGASCVVCGQWRRIYRDSGNGRMKSNIEAAHPTKKSYQLGVNGVVPLCHLCHIILDSSDPRRFGILEQLNNEWLGEELLRTRAPRPSQGGN